ncbi:MAG: alpha amylase C-terminal domain-containing protein [Candidatus Dormibacteraeota bacterium]|nr:alpha amylase C-terminal domain-containing protein [Candidatus Dormibacteraeota bacterium]
MASTATSTPRPGATPYTGGVTFRVWAPDATGVAVTGDFTGWSASGIALTSEPGGTWAADVAGAAAGHAYTYVVTTPAGRLTRVDPYTRQVRNDAQGDATMAVVYDEGAFDWGRSSYDSPGWSELVIYELHVGSFCENAAEAVGTLDDVAGKLSYLHELGISAVELMPVAGFHGAVSWGYDPGVPFTVEPAYGGPDGLKRFVRAAHRLGIAVILDVVYNHLGPGDSILWQFDGGGPGWDGGVYFYGARFPGDPRPQTPWGSRPDFGRPAVRQYLVDNATAWLEDYRLDGLRLDATAFIRNTGGDGDPSQDIPDGWRLLQEINDAVDGSQPWKLVIAEDMQGDGWITRPSGAEGAGFDAQWDPDFVRQLRDVLEQTDDGDRDMGVVVSALERRYGASAFARVVFTESHDADGNGRSRVPSEVDPSHPDSVWSKKRSILGAALVLTAPGIPMLFQGQEFLEQRPFVDDPATLDWSNLTTYAGIVQLYRDLIHLRRDWFATTAGLRGEGLNVFHVNNSAKVVAFHRFAEGGPGDDVVVVANFGNIGYPSYRIGLPRSGAWRVRLNSDWTGYDPTFGDWPSNDVPAVAAPQDGLAFSGDVGLGPYTAVILSQDR